MKLHRSMGVSLVLCATSLAGSANEPPAWITEGPYVEQETLAIDVPLEVLATKLLVEVEVGGKPRRFVFDTGSPSMLDASLARELGLEAIDRRQGRDGHGAVIETTVMQADFGLGGVTFHKVPVFVTGLPHTARCLFEGVLGSELLPLCAWQVDLPESRLRCHTDLDRLAHVDAQDRQVMHGFGYPHAPIFDVRFSDKARSKAMFDTGSAPHFSISAADLDGASRNRGVGRTISGQGSMGGSAGGKAPEREQRRLVLKSLDLGSMRLGPTEAILRDGAPSLLGAALLEHFVVTLDARSGAAWFDRYHEGPFARPSYGLGLDFEDGAKVSLLWDDSPAAAAGLALGQRITAINGRPTGGSCEDIRHAMRAMSGGDSIRLDWEGGSETLEPGGSILD